MHAIKSSFFFGIVEKDFEDLVQLQTTVTAFASALIGSFVALMTSTKTSYITVVQRLMTFLTFLAMQHTSNCKLALSKASTKEGRAWNQCYFR